MYAISVNYYFRVKDGAIYGGKGSVGYARISFGGIYPLANTHEDFEAQGKRLINNLADDMQTVPENIELITEEGYIAATEEDDDYDDEDDEDY